VENAVVSGAVAGQGEGAEWIGGRSRLDGPVHLADHDPAWAKEYEREANRIRSALGDRALLIEHVGSTSVPGLAAKPIIDIALVVPSPGDESSYVPQLESLGYALRIREPDWYQHRVLRIRDRVNLHVFPADCDEVDRLVAFRDQLRRDHRDRKLYESTKRALAASHWNYMQEYADAKAQVVAQILAHTGHPK
jgi:GrpB-like predicted nucleotidyltransferase (UPF0157 family)